MLNWDTYTSRPPCWPDAKLFCTSFCGFFAILKKFFGLCLIHILLIPSGNFPIQQMVDFIAKLTHYLFPTWTSSSPSWEFQMLQFFNYFFTTSLALQNSTLLSVCNCKCNPLSKTSTTSTERIAKSNCVLKGKEGLNKLKEPQSRIFPGVLSSEKLLPCERVWRFVFWSNSKQACQYLKCFFVCFSF